MPDILVVGGDGTIGSALARAFAAAGRDVAATTRRRDRTGRERLWLDLAAPRSQWPELDACVAFLCAGITSIERCEVDPAGTRAVNVDAHIELIERLNARGAFVCALSTTAVFDGARPDYAPADARSPSNVYGRQKAELEDALRAAAPQRSCVVRLGKVVASGAGIFGKWCESLRGGRAISAYADAAVAPVSLGATLGLLERIEARRLPGTFHFTARDQMSYFDAAVRLAAAVGAPAELVAATPHPPGRRFGRYATLDCRSTAEAFGIKLPPAVEGVLWALGAA